MNWAVAQLQGDPRSVIAAVSCEDVVVMNGDKFAHDGGRTDFLSERRTVHGLFPNSTISADGTHPIWSFRRVMGDGFTETNVTENDERPLMVHMHDECIYRHKDVGKFGWTMRKMAS